MKAIIIYHICKLSVFANSWPHVCQQPKEKERKKKLISVYKCLICFEYFQHCHKKASTFGYSWLKPLKGNFNLICKIVMGTAIL